MAKQADITFTDSVFSLEGELDFSNVMSIYSKSIPQMTLNHELIFDFSKVKSSNSAGIALMIEWLKLSKQTNKSIHFKCISSDLMSLVKVANLEEMIVLG